MSLFERVVAFENLHAAAWEVFRGKRGRETANALFNRLEAVLLGLEAELRSGTYRPGPYHTFWIFDPKPRLISAAPLRDRIVHHAVVRVIEPLFERRFIHHSYACRTDKGNHRALDQFVRWSKAKRYVLMLDVHKFFPSVDHIVLKGEIRRGLKDARTLDLLDRIIDGSNPQEPVPEWFPGDELLTPSLRRRGIPIGNLTSQFLANVLMDRVDHLVKDRLRVKRYLRYVDDLAVFHDDRGFLLEVRGAIREELRAMRLRLNEGKSRLRRVKEGLTFLGFTVTPRGVRLAAPSVRRHRSRLRALQAAYARGEIDLREVRSRLLAFQAHAAHGDTFRLLNKSGRATPFRPPGYTDAATG